MLYRILYENLSDNATTSCYNNKMDIKSLLRVPTISLTPSESVSFTPAVQKRLANVSMIDHINWLNTYKQTTVETRPELEKYYIKRLQKYSISYKNVQSLEDMSEFIPVWILYQPLRNDKVAKHLIDSLKKDDVPESDILRAPNLTYLAGLSLTDSTAYTLSNTLIDILINRSNTKYSDPLHEFWDAKIVRRDKNNIPISIAHCSQLLNATFDSHHILMQYMSSTHLENIQLKLIYLTGNSELVKTIPDLKKYQTVLSLLDYNNSISEYMSHIDQITCNPSPSDTFIPLPEL